MAFIFPFLMIMMVQVLFIQSEKTDGDVYCKTVDIPDFYWREYNGAVPIDAIEGGKDRLGRSTYVGQAAVYKVGNIPATIYHGSNTAVTSSDNTIYVDKNVKILCSGSPQKFEWKSTDVDSMSLITNCLVIPGGLDYDDMAYIARVQFEGEVKIGKVLKKWNGILIPDNKGKEIIIKNFQLLVFDCKSEHVLDTRSEANVTNTRR